MNADLITLLGVAVLLVVLLLLLWLLFGGRT
jgi:hypothetical protein